jgi:NAD(P)H-hydrate epimerase
LPEAVLVGASLEAIKKREPDALVVGPGLEETDQVRDLVLAVIRTIDAPKVVDAGALNLVATVDSWWTGLAGELVLTPHPGEFERLTGERPGKSNEDRLAAARGASERFGQVVVLKGARTVIYAPNGESAVSPVANAALATAGSGDVLAGLIGALLAQGARPFDAACLGVYLHGRAGERLSMRLGNAGVLASDIAHEIPVTRHELNAHGG